MSSRTIQLSDQLHDYFLKHTLRESKLSHELRRETARMPNGEMQISPEQGQFMRVLIELMGARNAIEIGVFTGYSALCVASALPPDGKLIACDLSDEWTAVARRFWERAGVAGKIDLRLAPALKTLDALLADGRAGTFDFVFIDADRANVDNYYERALKLLRPGGLVAADNALRSGRVADPADNDPDTVMLRNLTRKAVDDPRVTACVIPIGDGLLLARKR